MDLRWSRGCGTGIGLSGHKNSYPTIVAINNFVEDRAGQDSKWYRFGKIEPTTSTYRAAHNRTPEQVSAALGTCTAKVPPAPLKQDKGKTILFEHLGPRQRPPDAFVTLNSLTYSQPHLDKRRAQKELWCGNKAIDLNVTQAQQVAGRLSATKCSSWEAHGVPERHVAYATTTRSAQINAALHSDPRAQRRLVSTTNVTAAPDSLCAPSIGRKATGGMCSWIDQKDRFVDVLDARRPIEYTVTYSTKKEATEGEQAASGAQEVHNQVVEAAAEAQNVETSGNPESHTRDVAAEV